MSIFPDRLQQSVRRGGGPAPLGISRRHEFYVSGSRRTTRPDPWSTPYPSAGSELRQQLPHRYTHKKHRHADQLLHQAASRGPLAHRSLNTHAEHLRRGSERGSEARTSSSSPQRISHRSGPRADAPRDPPRVPLHLPALRPAPHVSRPAGTNPAKEERAWARASRAASASASPRQIGGADTAWVARRVARRLRSRPSPGSALVLRLISLDDKAVHHDEARHAWLGSRLASGKGYSYDPVYHGPVSSISSGSSTRLRRRRLRHRLRSR